MHHSGIIEKIKLCKLENPEKTYTDPMAYTKFINGLEENEQEIVKEFVTSGWHNLNPSMKEFKDESVDPVVKYTSVGKNTEETKLFTFVFNAFVFMQVFN